LFVTTKIDLSGNRLSETLVLFVTDENVTIRLTGN